MLQDNYFGTPDFSAQSHHSNPGVEEPIQQTQGGKTPGFNKLKMVYFGTPDFSANLLEKLLLDKSLPVEITAVVTQPDMPVGRKKILTPSPVKTIADKHNLRIFDSMLHVISYMLHEKVDVALVYAFGKIIPADMLKIPKYGFINVHPSLLPKYRGASPMVYPLILGDKKTGVTIIKMDEKMDHGPIIAQQVYKILPADNRIDLESKLTDLGFDLFKNSITKFISNSNQFQLTNQFNQNATHTRLLNRNDGYIPISELKKALRGEKCDGSYLPPIIDEYFKKYPDQKKEFLDKTFNFSLLTFNLWRAYATWPGLWTKININGVEKRLKILDVSLVLHSTNYILHINSVQLEGKKPVSFNQFLKVYPI